MASQVPVTIYLLILNQRTKLTCVFVGRPLDSVVLLFSQVLQLQLIGK